jgi:phytoene desaturase
MSRVVVVGGGVGGLAAAARLAALGHTVTVCEQAATVGGKLGLEAIGGYRFGTGPSLLTMPHVFRALFADTGAPLEDVLDIVAVDPLVRYRFADGTVLDTSNDSAVTCANIAAALGAGAGEDWRRLLDRAERIWEAVEGPFLSTPVTSVLGLARQAARVRDLATVAPWRTLRGLGRAYLRDPRLRMLLERYATYSGSDPRRAPAALAAVTHAEQAFGGWYVRGGLRRLVEALHERAVEHGASVRTGADVEAVEVAGGRAAGVRLRGGEYLAADVVVANADAAHVYGDLVTDRRTAGARSRLRRATPSLSGFVLLLGVRGPTSGLAHHNVRYSGDYDAEFDAIFGPRPHPVEEPTIYVSAPDDPATRPDGCEAWSVLVNAPRHGPVDWDAPGLAEAYARSLLDVLAARGLDVRGRVEVQATITPAELERRTRAPGGAIYGTSSNGPGAAFLRPANRSPVRGLYLVGGSAHPGGGLPLVALSAQIVASMIGPDPR